MKSIVLTEAEYSASKSKEGLEAILNRVFAQAKEDFWKESHATIVWMVAESIPFLKALDVYLEKHEELRKPEFVAAAYFLKSKNPNMPPFEVMDLAARQFGVVSEPKTDEPVEVPRSEGEQAEDAGTE